MIRRFLVALIATVSLAACAVAPAADPTPNPTLAPTPTPTPAPSIAPAPTLEPPPTRAPTEAPTPSPEFGTAPIGVTEVATVLSITDGDTIRVDRGLGSEPVRYIGMNTPEAGDPGGSEATAENARLVEGMEVVLERDVRDTDDFGRLLRYVWIDTGSGWSFVNLELVRRGYAQAGTYPPDVRFADVFLAAEQAARTAAVGLWAATPEPVITPAPVSNCHPSYIGVCLEEGIGDYDCAGGSGNGPNYIDGPFRVVGYDEFGLDGNDNDGIGCE